MFTIQRTQANYHSETLDAQYSSASAIRKLLGCTSLAQALMTLETQDPQACLDSLKDNYELLLKDNYSIK